MRSARLTNDEITEGLASRKSKERRRAAKALAKNPVESLAEPLFRAYLKEIKDARTWETQCEMICAIGRLRHIDAICVIEPIVRANDPHDMITRCAATTYVQLKRATPHDAGPVLELVDFGSVSVHSGALFALAADEMVPSDQEIRKLLQYSWNINKHPDRQGQEFSLVDCRRYVALAAARWKPSLAHSFLRHCIDTAYDINRFGKPSRNTNLVDICKNSLAGKISKGYI